MALTLYERETIINYNEGDKTAGVYTHNRALRRKLEKLATERPEECRLEKVSREGDAVDYIVPKSWVHIRPPRVTSEAQRVAAAERMKAANLRRKAHDSHVDSGGPAAETGKDTPEDIQPKKQPSDGGKED